MSGCELQLDECYSFFVNALYLTNGAAREVGKMGVMAIEVHMDEFPRAVVQTKDGRLTVMLWHAIAAFEVETPDVK